MWPWVGIRWDISSSWVINAHLRGPISSSKKRVRPFGPYYPAFQLDRWLYRRHQRRNGSDLAGRRCRHADRNKAIGRFVGTGHRLWMASSAPSSCGQGAAARIIPEHQSIAWHPSIGQIWPAPFPAPSRHRFPWSRPRRRPHGTRPVYRPGP